MVARMVFPRRRGAPGSPARSGAPGGALRRILPALSVFAAALLGGAEAACAGDDSGTHAAAVTDGAGSLDRALDLVLGRGEEGSGGSRAVVFLLDVAKSVADAAVADRIEAALARNARELEGVPIGLVCAGAEGTDTLPAGRDRAVLVDALSRALAGATGNPARNLYADVRAAARAFPQSATDRRLVVVTLTNGDIEDDLEATVSALRRARVTCDVIAAESFLADSYGLSHPGMVRVPRGATWQGGDGAFPEIPWGWLFQGSPGNELAPSGFASFGLTRLAESTGGHVYLYRPRGGKHECSWREGCPFCTGDHLPPFENYEFHRIAALAPAVGARADVLRDAARDPWLRATLRMWNGASREGLLRSRPPVKPGRGTLVPERRPAKAGAGLPGNSLAFPRLAKKAREMREAGERVLSQFEDDLARIDPASGSQRHRACADTARVLLALTLTNLFLFESWCQEAGPALCGKEAREDIEPPEVPRVAGDLRIGGWGLTYNCLCHGVAPFRARRMAGGPEFAARLDALEKLLDGFFARYDHTPYGFAVRRSSLATFLPTYIGTTVPPPPRKGSSSSDAPTTPDVPDRGGGSGSGGGNPTSGG